MKRKAKNQILILGGVVVIIIALLIFVPAIFGSASAGGTGIEKYNGTSQAGNESVKTAHSVDVFLVGLFGSPLVLGAFASALLVVCAVLMLMLRRK